MFTCPTTIRQNETTANISGSNKTDMLLPPSPPPDLTDADEIGVRWPCRCDDGNGGSDGDEDAEGDVGHGVQTRVARGTGQTDWVMNF